MANYYVDEIRVTKKKKKMGKSTYLMLFVGHLNDLVVGIML